MTAYKSLFEDSVNSSGNSETNDANVFKIAAGVKYFPFVNYLALNGYLEYYNADYTYKEQGSAEFKYSISGPRLRADLTIYF